MGGFNKWKKLEEAHGRDESFYENDTRTQEEIMGYSLAAPDTYTAAGVAERLRNYYDNPARQAARRAERTRYVSQKINEDDEDDEDKAGEIERVRNWFAQRVNSGSERNRWADRIVAHNAQAERRGISPQYDVNDAASAYLGYMQLPETARDPQLEEYYRTIHEGTQAGLQARVEDARQQEMQRNADWFSQREAEYGKITSRPEFTQNIEGWETQTGYAGNVNDNTPEAEAYYNYMMYTPEEARDPETERRLREDYERSGRAIVDDARPMTDEQKQIYQYLLNTEGEDAARDYYNYISYDINARQMEDRMQRTAAQTDTFGGKVLSSIASVPTNLLGGVAGFGDIVKQNVRNAAGEYRPIDYNSGAQRIGNYAQAVRENTMEDMGGVGRFLYSTGMSMADSVASIAIGGQYGGVLLGFSAAQSAVQEAHERGASDTQALASGIFAGAAEMIFENIGIDNLFKIAEQGMTDSARNIIKNIVSQMLAEGGEEVGTTISNTITDAIIMADKSELNTAIAQYEAQGMNHEDAVRQAWLDWAKNLALDFFGGAVSGGVMGSGGLAVGTYNTGRAVQQSGQAQDVVDYASQFGSDAAKALAQRVGTGDNASAIQLGRMFSNIENPVTDAYGGVDVRATIDRRIAQLEQETAQREAAAQARLAQADTASETAQETSMRAAEEVVEQAAKPAQAANEAANEVRNEERKDRKPRPIRAKDSNGESVEIVDAVMGQDSNIAFKTADGRTILADDLDTTGQPKTMRLVEWAEKLSEEGASGLVTNYDGGDVMPYIRAYNLVYERAQRNMSMNEALQNVELPSDAAQAAYTAGQAERMANEGSQEERGGVIRSFTGTVSKQKENALKVLNDMFRAIGRTLVVTDTLNYVDADGTVRTSGSNAQFDPKTNRYTIALDAIDDAYINVAVHETVHDIKANSPADYDMLQEIVFEWLKANGKDIEKMRDAQRALAKGRDNAYYDEEIVANTVPEIFAERKTFRQFMNEFMSRDAFSDEHRRVFMELVDSVLEFIKNALDNLSQYRSWSQIKGLRQQHDMIAAVRDAYFSGLQNATRQDAQGEGDTRESIKTMRDGRYYVEADRRVIRGNDPTAWANQVTNYINREIRKGRNVTVYAVDGDALTITRDSAGKAQFRNKVRMENGKERFMTDDEYAVKLRAEGHIDELAQVSVRGNKTVPDKKNHRFARDGFNYRTAYFMDNTGYYRLTISVGKNGVINTVYNVGKIKKADFPMSGARLVNETTEKGAQRLNAVQRPQERTAYEQRVTQGGSPVNRNIRGTERRNSLKDDTYMSAVESGDMETAQQMVDEAARDAGYTVRGNHGTTQLFTIFDREKGNPEGDFGRGFYFTTNEEDVNANYASSDGQDLTNKIEILAENMEWMDGYEDMDYDERLEEARKMLDGGNNRVIKAALRIENPVVLGGRNETFFDAEEEYDEENDEYGEASGLLIEFADALRTQLAENDENGGYGGSDAEEVVNNIVWDAFGDGGIGAYDLTERLKNEASEYVQDADGKFAFNEILRATFERMGFDAIEDHTVARKFGSNSGRAKAMAGVNEDTTHYIVFSSNQVKQTDPVTYDDDGNVIPLSQRFNPEQQDIRYSAKDTADSQGNELSPAQQEYFADSKVRDENGNLLVMYHGTPKAGFTEFRSGTYFTQDREYADVYQNPGASSLRVKTGEMSPDTYEVYLNITKPFDTRNARERRIFEREFYGEYGGTPLAESGLPDWTDGVDLLDFIEEHGYDYDGLILDEGGTGGYGEEVRSRGLSYVVMSPEQVKNVDNKTPTDNPDIRYSAKDTNVDLEAENRQLRRDVRTAQTEARRAQRQVEHVREVERTRYDRHDESITRQKYRDRINRRSNELYQWLAKPNDRKHVPASMTAAVVNVLRALDFERRAPQQTKAAPGTKTYAAWAARQQAYENGGSETNRSRLWAQRMQKLSEVLTTAEGSKDEALSAFGLLLDPDLADDIKAFAENNSDVPISSMNSTQLRELSQLMGRVKNAVTETNKMHGQNRGKQVSEVVEQTAKDFRVRRSMANSPIGKLLRSRLYLRQMDAGSFFHMLGDGATTIYNGLRSGFDKFITNVDEAIKVSQAVLKNVDVKRLNNIKQGIEIETADGKIMLTRAQVMSLYCLDKRDAGRQHLYGEGGGVVSVRDNVQEAHAVTETQVKAATSKLTDEERKAADALQQFMSTRCTEWGNEATMEMYGYRKFGEEFYFPIKSVRTSFNESDQQQVGDTAALTAIKNRGFTKALKENATNPVVIDDILSVYSAHVADMAEYNAYLAPLADAMRWYNWRGTVQEGVAINLHQEWLRAFPDTVHIIGEKKGKTSGNPVEEYFLDFIRRLNGGGTRSAETLPMVRFAKSAAVGLNLSVAIQQGASYSKAVSMIDRKWLWRGLPSRKNARLAEQYAPIAKWKSWGFFQSATGKNVESLLNGDTSLLRKARDKQGFLAEFGDRVTWARLWGACAAEQRSQDPNRDAAYYKSEEFYQKVGARLSQIIDGTQVVDSVFHRSPVTENKVLSIVTAFMSETMKSYSMLAEAEYNYRVNKTKANREHLNRTKRGLVASQLAAAVLQAFVGAWRDKDKEKGNDWAEKALIKMRLLKPVGKYTYGQKLMVRALENAAGNMNPLNLHWLTAKLSDEIFSALSDWTPSSTLDTKVIESFGKLFKELKKDEEADAQKILWYTVEFVSYMTGIGVQNVYRDLIETPIRKIMETKTGFTPGMDEVFYFGGEGESIDGSMDAVLAAETAEVQQKNPSYSADKAEREARGNLRGEITSEYKEVYAQAFAEGDTETMTEIKRFMADTGLYIDGTEPADACERWLRDYFKTQYLEATTDEERKEARRLLMRSGYYDSPRELNEAIEGWTQ